MNRSTGPVPVGQLLVLPDRPPAARESTGRPLRLLIIEDSPDDAKLVTLCLAKAGFELAPRVVARREELESAMKAGPWDAVVSDFALPGFTGMEALEIVRSRDADVPFILVSGVLGEEMAIDAVKAGASDYVIKSNLGRLAPALERGLREAAIRASHRHSQRALADSEERFRQLFQGNPLPTWVFDLSTLRFLDVNDHACRVYGYSREEFLAMTVNDIRPADDAAVLKKWLDQNPSGSLAAGIWRHRKKDGSVFHVEIVTHEADFRGSPARYVCALDVTQRLLAQARIAKLSQAVEQSPAATVITDTEGRIEYVNSRFVEITGYSAEEAIGKTPSLINSGLTPAHVYRELWASIKAGRSWHGKMQNRRKSGELYWEDEYISPLRDELGRITHFIAVKEDITARMEAEEKSRESESRFRQLAENINEAFFLADIEGKKVLYASRAYETISGRSRESLYAAPDSWSELIPAADRARVLAEYAKKRGSGKFEFEYSIVRDDGEAREVRMRGFPIHDADGRVYRIAGIAEDVTDRRRAERRLRESERRYADVLDNINLLSVMMDRDGFITYCNDHLLELTGWKRAEVLGRDWFDLYVPPELVAARRAEYAAMLVSGTSGLPQEREILTRSGERRLVSSFSTLLRSIEGEVVGTATIGDDITDYRKAEEEVRRLNRELESRVAERTAELAAANMELGAFSHTVSHDLRAPLNRIRGFSAVLLEDDSIRQGARGAELLRRVENAAREMDELIADLMELSTVTSGELRRVALDVSEIAAATVDELRAAHPARSVEVAIQGGLSAIGDAGLVRIVLTNLIGNAWKFTAKRDRARIEVGRETDGPQRGAYFVRDNGAGFDMSYAHKLFSPFQRLHAKGEFEGTGIGLATVARIIRRHGGCISAHGEVGEGATFHFTLGPGD